MIAAPLTYYIKKVMEPFRTIKLLITTVVKFQGNQEVEFVDNGISS